MTTDIKTFQPITRDEAERIVPDIARGSIEGANARDAAFFIYAHGRMNPGRRFAYTVKGTSGMEATRDGGRAIQLLQIDALVFDGASYGVTARELKD